jgi:hypothetical protein
LMTCRLKTRREYASDIAVVIDDENVSQADPRLAVQAPFYCSTSAQHQEPPAPRSIASCTTPIAQAIAVRTSHFSKSSKIIRNHCGLHLAD